ncbi:MAG TPA: adenylate/guanylate cyclase domain-containing protein [Ohtaekwangia sp.]
MKVSKITTLIDQEEVKSQLQRTYLLITFFTFLLAFATLNFAVVSQGMVIFYGGLKTFIMLCSFVLAFLIYQIVVLKALKKRIKQELRISVVFKVIQTTIEISLPSTIMFYMLRELNMTVFLDSPVYLIYFLFIILSILHLDYRMNIYAGSLAALQYILLTYYGFNFAKPDALHISTTPENAHYVRSILLFLSGGAAAFVSMKLKNRIKTNYIFQQEKNELELLFGQQVSREVSKTLIEKKGETKKIEATVMFLDIRNFTGFADTHTAEEVIDFQNKVLSPVIEIINQHQGVVFQILGDGVMACFGSPVENVLHADMAFQSGLNILKKIQELSEQNIIPATAVGIGLHSGLLVTGNIGNEYRKQFSISGTPVIIASRIEQLNKKYSSQFLLSGTVYDQITLGKADVSFIGKEELKGITRPVDVYRVK